MYLGKAGQKSHSAHLGLNCGFNFITSYEEVNFRVPSPFQQLPWGEKTASVKSWGRKKLCGLDEP